LSEPIRDKRAMQKFYDDPQTVATYLRRKEGPLRSVLHARQVRFVNDTIARLEPQAVLELAPGPARLSAEIGPVPFAVGMDFSFNMLAVAKRRCAEAGRPYWHFCRGDGFMLPFPNAAFDLIFSVRFVRRWELPQRRALYAEIRRVLKPGGHLILDAQNKLVAGPHREGRTGYPVYDELWLREDLVRELTEASFTVQHLEGIMRRFTLQWRLNRLQRFRLGTPAKLLIQAIERTASDENPSTWMVLSESPGR